jgi:hypothetical protein
LFIAVLDYCPLFGSTYGGMEAEQLACKDTVNTDTLNIYSEVYGSDSQCIPTIGGDGRCYRTACVKDEMVLRINIRGEWLACEYDFQKLDVRVGAGECYHISASSWNRGIGTNTDSAN